MKEFIHSYKRFALIFVCVFIALCPVILSANYIRQDDLMWEIWPWMKVSDFGYLYYNTMYQLVRPLCMISFYITDLISIDIHHAIFVRLFCVILTGVLAIMLYQWQILFNRNKLLATTFAITMFTLPPYQIFAATGNYSLIMTALLLTMLGVFFWHRAFTNQTSSKRTLYYIGCAFIFASFLDYPLSSMFSWAMLTIVYLTSLTSLKPDLQKRLKRFCLSMSLLMITLMIGYYVFGRLIHLLLHVNLTTGRSAIITTTDIIPRMFGIFEVISWHAHLWWWNDLTAIFSPPLLLILTLLILAMIRLNYHSPLKRKIITITQVISVVFFFLFMSYSPILASPDIVYTFRYGMVTMPILLYVGLWSIFQLLASTSRLSKFASIAFCMALTMSAIGTANLMLADGVVGPHDNDFAFIQAQLTQHVIPLLEKNQKVLLHATDCIGKNMLAEHTPRAFEYGMRTCQYQQQVIGVIIHSLRKMGYASNENAHNKVIYYDNEIVVEDTPWGTLVVTNLDKPSEYIKTHSTKNYKVVEIDTTKNTAYQPYQLYKNVLGKWL